MSDATYSPCSFAAHGVTSVQLFSVCPEANSFSLRIKTGEFGIPHEIVFFCASPLAIAWSLREAAALAHASYVSPAPLPSPEAKP